MSYRVAIIGAGLMGRILALECQLAGFSVSLIDQDNKEGKKSCASTGAGMLSPFSELETAEPIISALGVQSLALWPEILKAIPQTVYFQQQGTLVVAHPQDQPDLLRFRRAIEFKLASKECQQLLLGQNISQTLVNCNRENILSLESELPRTFTEGIFLPTEGQVDNKQLLEALKVALDKCEWHTGIDVASLSVSGVECQHLSHHNRNVISQLGKCDFIVDCRGLGSRADIPQLRGVRGELLLVEAPDVKLNRPIRLMHPRHPIYIVPRQDSKFIIGATSIESEDMRPLTVQSALELLSAACTVHPAFAEAVILETRVNCRPALLNNLPAIILPEHTKAPKIIRINGLYRHGFLIAPKLARLVLGYMINGQIKEFTQLVYKGDSALALSH